MVVRVYLHGDVTHRDALVAAMRRLALKKGFAATTVDEICELAGVTKGSFYHHFDSKDDLGVAALESYFADVVAAFSEGDWSAVEDPVAKLHAFVAHAGAVCVGPVMTYGCLIGSYSLDLAESWPHLRDRLAAMFAALRDFVGGLVRDAAQAAGRPVDAAPFGDQFLAVIEGSIVLSKAHGDPQMPRRQMALLGEHLELLLTPPG